MTGLRLAEGSNINKSLLALGKVINKLSEKNSEGFVPYRDSKLTRMLKDSLGGNTKTVLVTCISSHKAQTDETIHSLNYATRAKKIKLVVSANLVEEVVARPHLTSQIQPNSSGLSGLAQSQHTVTSSTLEAGAGAGNRQEVELLRSQLRQLQEQLAREKGGSETLKENYVQLVGEFQEQWDLRNSLKEIGELLVVNGQRLAAKKRMLVGADGKEPMQKKVIIEEIKGLEELVQENEDIRYELEKRLSELEDRQARKLGLNPRSVSPIVANRVQKREAIREKSQSHKDKVKLSPGPSNRAWLPKSKDKVGVENSLTDRATEKKTTTKKASATSGVGSGQERVSPHLKGQTLHSRVDATMSSQSYQLNYPSNLIDAGDVLGNKKPVQSGNRRLEELGQMSSFDVEVVEIEGEFGLDESHRREVRKNIDFDQGESLSRKSLTANLFSRHKGEDELLVMDLLQGAGSQVNRSQMGRCSVDMLKNFGEDVEDSQSRMLLYEPETYIMQESIGLPGYSGNSQSEFEHIKNELHHEIERGQENSSSREMRIEEKLQKAREKMREFKKKLHLMSSFLEKYEEKALEKGSSDIMKAVVELMREHSKQNYLLKIGR